MKKTYIKWACIILLVALIGCRTSNSTDSKEEISAKNSFTLAEFIDLCKKHGSIAYGEKIASCEISNKSADSFEKSVPDALVLDEDAFEKEGLKLATDIRSIAIWGNYCGPKSGPGPTIDCVDAACKIHDGCIPTVSEWMNPEIKTKCEREFCTRLFSCKAYKAPKPIFFAIAGYGCASGSSVVNIAHNAAISTKIIACTLAGTARWLCGW